MLLSLGRIRLGGNSNGLQNWNSSTSKIFSNPPYKGREADIMIHAPNAMWSHETSTDETCTVWLFGHVPKPTTKP